MLNYNINPSTDPVEVTLSTALNKDFDSMDVAKMSKGIVTTTHSAISATTVSSEIDCRGFNSILIHVVITGTGTWKADLQNAVISGGVVVDAYDGATQLSTGDLTTSRCVLLRGVSSYIKIKATEVADGATCTINVQPLNL